MIKLIKSQEDELVESMRQRRGLTNPEVGSFFYDLDNHKLTMVDSIPTKYCPTNGGGKKTTDKLHEDIWFENYRERLIKLRTCSVNGLLFIYKQIQKIKTLARVNVSPVVLADKIILAIAEGKNKK